MSYGMNDSFDPLIEEGKHRSDYIWCGHKSSNPNIRNLQLGWWRNFFIFGIFVTTVVLAATSGGVAYGLVTSAPMMEKTSNATLGMRHDTQKLVKDAKSWWAETMMTGYPKNQDQLWLARFDSISASVQQILGAVSGSIDTKGLNIEGLIGTGIKSLVSEFITSETKVQIDLKIRQVLDKLEPGDITKAIDNFNKLSIIVENAEKKGVVTNVNKLIQDVDKTVMDFQKGRKITLEAKM